MSTISEQISAAFMANVEVQQTVINSFSDKLNERTEELTRLSVDLVKATLAESLIFAKELLDAKNSQSVFSISAAHYQREIQSATYHANEAMRITSATADACNKAMTQYIAEASRHGSGLLMELTKNIPSTAEQMTDLIKSSWSPSSDTIQTTVNEDIAPQKKQQPKDVPSNQPSRKKNFNHIIARTVH